MEFLQDQSHEIIYRVDDLPIDVHDRLFTTLNTKNIANYGEGYNKSDLIVRSIPIHQHQFSLVSAGTAAVLISKGGDIPSETLLLFSRRKQGAICDYDVRYHINTEVSIRGLIRRDMEENMAKKEMANNENVKAIRVRAEAGDAEAQLQLYYVEGRHRSDIKWLCRAADQGQRHAQRQLAGDYARGTRLVKQDQIQALVWYILAVKGGAEEYRSQLEELAATMSLEQIEEVERRLDAWVPGQCERALVLK